MKTTIWILITAIALTILVSCAMQNQTSTEVSVLYDVTDMQVAEPNADEILALYNLQDKWDGITFRFANLTDVSYNQVSTAKLDAKNEWLSNEMDRDKEIKAFKSKVIDIIANRKTATNGKSNSSIYLPITAELNRLSQSKAEKKLLIIYSDLMENTENLSFYKKQDITQLKNNPKEVQQQLEKQAVIKNLAGIEIWFIYQPTDNKSDQDFQTVSRFYKDLLESKGAKVTLSANLTF